MRMLLHLISETAIGASDGLVARSIDTEVLNGVT